MEEERVIGIGSEAEQVDFIKRHELFLKRFANLKKALNTAFAREFSGAEPIDRVVFSLGRLCAEDFMEIIVLAGNGYGIGALKILRGIYERLVTALYLHARPEETDNFLDFYCVAQYRLTQAVIDTFGEEVLLKDKLEESRNMYNAVKEKFMITECAKCQTKRLNHTWSKLDFVSMAREVGSIWKFIVPAYYIPTQLTHSTVRAILSRLEEVQEGGIIFAGDAQRKEADDALRLGHLLVLNSLGLEREHFKLEDLQEELDECYRDFGDIWHKSANREGGKAALEAS